MQTTLKEVQDVIGKTEFAVLTPGDHVYLIVVDREVVPEFSAQQVVTTLGREGIKVLWLWKYGDGSLHVLRMEAS